MKVFTVSYRWTVGAVLLMVIGAPLFAGFAGTDVFLPSVGRKPGNFGSQYYTMLWIHNPSASTANVTIAFLLRDHPNPSPATYLDSIPPGDSHSYPDTITTLFNTQAWGALRITANVRVLAVCRMYNLPAAGQDKDTQGQDYNAIPASFAIGSGQSTKLLGVSQTNPKADSQFRYSFGWVEAAGGTANVQVIAFDESGTQVASKTYPTTGAYEARYYPIEDLYPAVNATDLTLEVSVVSGTGKVIPVGSGTANASNDSTTFEMQFDDALLASGTGGLSAVTHNATLTGDGTVSSPLGIARGGVDTPQLASAAVTNDKIASQTIVTGNLANNAVTAAKIATSGGSTGQVLTVTASGAAWQAPATLTLPYSGSVSSSSTAFSVTNSGTGYGMQVYGGSSSDAIQGTCSANNRSGVYGHSSGSGAYGVWGDSANGVGVYGGGKLQGVSGESDAGSGIYGKTSTGNAGLFDGNVKINGTLSKTAGSFKIDHPLDPANKYLYHSFVESPDMMDIYNGNVVTDTEGLAVVDLPEWFEALNRDFRYQLTVIGRFAQAIVEREIESNRFVIRTSLPNVKVSWQVTGIRHDAYAEAHRIPVEEDKPAAERGYFLHPELFGFPAERSTSWALYPDLMQRLKEVHEGVAQPAK